MGLFVKGGCPCCGWQVSPAVWRRSLADPGVVGMVFSSSGRGSLSCVGPLRKPAEVENADAGLFSVMAARLVDAVARWVRWRWVPLRDVLNALPVYDMGNGMWVENYERWGGRPGRRVAYDYDLIGGRGREIYSRAVNPVAGREVNDYAW